MSRQVLLAEYTTIKQSVWLRGNKAHRAFPPNQGVERKGKKNYKVEFPLVVVVGVVRGAGGAWLQAKASGSLRLQGRQYYIQCDG